MKEFKTNNKNHSFEVEPSSKYRLKDEEIETDDLSMISNIDIEANLEQLTDDFKFENRNSIVKKPKKVKSEVPVAEVDLVGEFKEECRGASLVRRKTVKLETEKEIEFSDFKLLMVLGRGAFGKVFLGELQTTKELFAIKSIRKDILIEMDQVDNTLLEK